ncbi:hypothetical protein IV203_016938 [Nitzschia inconspicua]|uniref:Glycosyltransferase family 8 protein n=1 Tax=Nitzschia inconspicua TaxID=303405 RepID=A0A9K3KQP4_9STRA|nr:hypothetical protein IV203_016938 [Nitzschia inconspicua]
MISSLSDIIIDVAPEGKASKFLPLPFHPINPCIFADLPLLLRGDNTFVGAYSRKFEWQIRYQRGDDTPTIGVASTVTGCGESPFQDGAAVLKYSLDRHSAANGNGRYNYQTYIFYHPNATSCVLPLQALGFTLIKRATPIRVEEIQGEELRERIVKNGCCGEKELIKLEAYRLVQHPLVIHVDLDVLILKPMDDVIDFMLHPTTRQYNLQKVPLMWPEKPIPNDIQLLFTKDYNMVGPKRRDKPFQGGFFIIKPSLEAYDEFIRIVKEGDYHVKGGWGKKVGPFYGGMTIQGLLPYFYEHLHPGRAVELNRCIYNNMNDNPFMERKNGEKRCRTDQESCEDCRFRPKEDVVTFHFTICQKPWSCLSFRSQQDKFKLCREMNHEWFAYRSKLEQTWGRSGFGPGEFKPNHYLGYCSDRGTGGYLPIALPYGQA